MTLFLTIIINVIEFLNSYFQFTILIYLNQRLCQVIKTETISSIKRLL